MKNKILKYLVFVIFLTFFIIIPTFSFFSKSIISSNNILTTGEWVPAETSIVLNHQQRNYQNDESVFSYIEEDGEYFQIEISDNLNQFLSFSYRVASQESAELFDVPTIEVFIDNKIIAQIALKTFDNQWHSASVDLALLDLELGTHDLVFSTKNTYDDLYMPQLEIKEVTTKKLFVKSGDKLSFYPSKEVSSLIINYNIWENNQEINIQDSLVQLQINNSQYFEFNIPDNFYSTELSYWSVDLFNNIEVINYVSIDLSTNLAIGNFEFNYFLESDNELNIQTKYQNLSVTSKFYLAKISDNHIINQKQHHQYINNNLQISNEFTEVTNNLVFTNLPTNNNYLTLKLCNVHFVCENVIDNLLLE